MHKLGQLATIKTNFAEADFWLTRRGSLQACGYPTREFSREHIGIKVNRLDLIDPNFLYYWMLNLCNQGYWRQFTGGATKLKNITTSQVKNIPINFRENPRKIVKGRWVGRPVDPTEAKAIEIVISDIVEKDDRISFAAGGAVGKRYAQALGCSQSDALSKLNAMGLRRVMMSYPPGTNEQRIQWNNRRLKHLDPYRDYPNPGLFHEDELRDNPSHLDSVRSLQEMGHGNFEDYYPKTAAGEYHASREEDLYYGRDVIWDGDEGRMVKADPDYIQHIWGNLFDSDKLAAVVSGIEEAEDRIVFEAPYGTATKIGLQDVRESIEFQDDEGLDRPYTTGDEELDRYLIDPESVLEEYADPEDPEYQEKREEMDGALDYAVEHNEGDLGEWAVTIRDGNHRAFGALLAGEPFVWVMISKNQYQDYISGVSPDLKEILE